MLGRPTDAYALWIVGLVVLCLTLIQTVRAPRPARRRPRVTRANLSTVLAWLIIAVVVVEVILSHRR